MQPLIVSRRSEIAEICKRRGVLRLEVFGSAARGDFDDRTSDIDFLVEFDDHPGASALETYFGLKEELEALFGKPVDLVMPAAVRNPYIRAELTRDRQIVYAA